MIVWGEASGRRKGELGNVPIYACFMPVEYTKLTGRLSMTFAHGMKAPTRLLSG